MGGVTRSRRDVGSGRWWRAARGLVGLGAAAVVVRFGHELVGFRTDIEANVDFDDAIPVDGLYGAGFAGAPIVLGVMGDSLACGRGASAPGTTVAARLADGLAALEERPVRLVNVARSGSSSRHLDQQVGALAARLGPGAACDLVYISVGAIDVSNSVTWGVARADIRMCAHDLTSTGAKVVFSMPERASLATSFAGRPLLSAVCDGLMRRRAAKQRLFLEQFAATGYHVRAADSSELTRRFVQNPQLTSDDLVHPSDAGQTEIAAVMVPQLAEALHDMRPTHPRLVRAGDQ